MVYVEQLHIIEPWQLRLIATGFYINLPCGAVTAIVLFFFFFPPAQAVARVSIIDKLKRLDLPGFFLFSPAVVMLLLALQWGGNLHAWKSAMIIGLILGAFGVLVLFGAWQWYKKDEASIPPDVFTQRSVFFGAVVSCLAMGGLQLVTYYLPIWFQVIKNSTPTDSGIMYFPSVVGNVLFSLFAGVLGKITSLPMHSFERTRTYLPSFTVTKLGYYNPWLLFGTAMTSIGAGLYTTFKTDSGAAAWIGYQAISGAGIGSILQMVRPTPPEHTDHHFL